MRVKRRSTALTTFLSQPFGTQRFHVVRTNEEQPWWTWSDAGGPVQGTPSGNHNPATFLTFRCIDLPGYQDIANLFTYVRLNWVKVTFNYNEYPDQTDFGAAKTMVDWPKLYLAPSYDPDFVPQPPYVFFNQKGARTFEFHPNSPRGKSTSIKIYPGVRQIDTVFQPQGVPTDPSSITYIPGTPRKGLWLPCAATFNSSAEIWQAGLAATLDEFAESGAVANWMRLYAPTAPSEPTPTIAQVSNMITYQITYSVSFKGRGI